MSDKVRLIDANRLLESISNLDVECADRKRVCIMLDTIRNLFPMIVNDEPTIEAETDNGWISVEDRLPALLEKVLTYGGNGKILMNWLEELEDGDFYFTCGGKIITHWMPLPTPPESDDVADDDVVECDFNNQICEPNVPWVDDDTLPNEDMIPDNEFIGGF